MIRPEGLAAGIALHPPHPTLRMWPLSLSTSPLRPPQVQRDPLSGPPSPAHLYLLLSPIPVPLTHIDPFHLYGPLSHTPRRGLRTGAAGHGLHRHHRAVPVQPGRAHRGEHPRDAGGEQWVRKRPGGGRGPGRGACGVFPVRGGCMCRSSVPMYASGRWVGVGEGEAPGRSVPHVRRDLCPSTPHPPAAPPQPLPHPPTPHRRTRANVSPPHIPRASPFHLSPWASLSGRRLWRAARPDKSVSPSPFYLPTTPHTSSSPLSPTPRCVRGDRKAHV